MDSASLARFLISFGFSPEKFEEATKLIEMLSNTKESIICVLVAWQQIKETFSFPCIKALQVAIVLFNKGYPDFGLLPTEFSSQPW